MIPDKSGTRYFGFGFRYSRNMRQIPWICINQSEIERLLWMDGTSSDLWRGHGAALIRRDSRPRSSLGTRRASQQVAVWRCGCNLQSARMQCRGACAQARSCAGSRRRRRGGRQAAGRFRAWATVDGERCGGRRERETDHEIDRFLYFLQKPKRRYRGVGEAVRSASASDSSARALLCPAPP